MDKAGYTGSCASGSTLSRYNESNPRPPRRPPGAKATFSLTGRTVAVSRLGPTRGKATIYVDGTKVASIDL